MQEDCDEKLAIAFHHAFHLLDFTPPKLYAVTGIDQGTLTAREEPAHRRGKITPPEAHS